MSARARSANADGLMESHRKIVGGARLRRRADGGAILRNIGEAGGAAPRHIRIRHVAPADLHSTAIRIAQADQRLDQLVLAVARDACNPDNLAAPHGQAHPVDRELA